MKKSISVSGVVFSCLFIAASSVYAVPYGFINITNESPNVASQLQMDVTADGTKVKFRFANDVGMASSVMAIYFDDAVSPLLSYDSMSWSTGVSFGANGSSGNFPGGNSLNPQFTSSFWYDSRKGDPKPSQVENGINAAGEWLEIVFGLNNGNGFGDLVGALDGGDLRVGLHVQSIDGGDSDSFVNTPVPEPGTMLLFGTGLIGLASVRRKNKA